MDNLATIRREDARTAAIPVRLDDGTTVYIEATSASDDVNVSSTIADFDKLTTTIISVAKSLGRAIAAVGPSKASVEFGIEASFDSGGLTALIVKGSSKANLKVTLEWSDNVKPGAGT